ncbi:predicted protein [Naegleria gruberi]|uniref:Predicted protein n=1 Tax=Naegleria gruberi TaxID=5762 RepID=D2V981_NAEGR|nr:uncharacterized protein NAEGRDRAFT_47786 [Naegleria gruberi]EFC46542.1 predicted protein [Naegleria gruberi]|eukprot:XP_002679286.1 predicted protein [Naegleria gruberi strain NEG-M]
MDKVDGNTTKKMDPQLTFKAYSKIENHHQESFVSKLLEKETEDSDKKLEWVCLEKVHGSNFSFIVVPKEGSQDKVEVLKANRTNVLTILSNFFVEAQKEVYERYYKSCVKLFEIISQNAEKFKRKTMETESEITKIHIFGELFGGYFPKLKNDQDSNGIRKAHIQKGVYYCPHYDFYVFDVAVTFGDQDTWLLFDEADPILEEAGFRVRAKPLFRGSLKECLDFDVEINTIIPQTFYSDILTENDILFKEKENICEGVVIKPANGTVFVGSRAIIKKKNSKFTEVNPAKDKSKRMKKQEKSVDQDEQEMISNVWNEIERYLNNNRLDNVVSKVGNITRENLSLVLKNFVNDAIEDYDKDQQELGEEGATLSSLPVNIQKSIKKKLGSTCQAILLKYMNENKQ